MMSKFTSQSKATILIIKDFQVQLLIWEDQTLTLIESYADFQDGQERFGAFLDDHLDYPLIVLNDVIEESFRNETVVHVSATDRKALLERKLSYSFRNTLYRAARITGREESGRRDDTVMLSAITKPELVHPWIEKVLSKKIAIQSVSSVAYLIENYLGKAQAKSPEHLMVVSLEDGKNLRQTYVKRGRVLFGRLTTLADTDTASIGSNIYQESLQIRQYLERIKLLSYEDSLEIRVFAPHRVDELASGLQSSRLNSFECIDTREEAHSLNLVLKEVPSTGLYVFLAQVLQKKRIENIYAYFDIRRYFYLKVVSQALALAASACIVISMIVNAPTFSDTLDKRNLIAVTESQSAPLRAEYARLTQGFPETPIDSKEMALVVETYETIQRQSYMPMEAMSILSQALEQSPELQLSKVDWVLSEKVRDQSADQGFFGAQPIQAAVSGMEFTQAVLDDRSSLSVQIDGIAYSPSSYREAQEQVLGFAEALEEFPGVSVTPLKMPTDVRVDTRVVTTVDDGELRAAFTLEMKIEMEPQE